MLSTAGRGFLYTISFVIIIAHEALARSSSRGWKRIPSVPQYPPPTFRAYENDADFPDAAATGARLRVAWLDMWHIAAIACVTFDETEDVYKRYFEPGEWVLVQQIFCNVAGIDDPLSCDIFTMEPISNVHMQDLTIIAGRATDDEVPPSEQPDLDNPDLEIAATTFQDLGPEENKAYTQLYKRAFDFPTLDDIFTKRTCDGLGPYDSGLMTSLGAHLLHEMIHWRLLVRASNNEQQFDAVITHDVWLPDPDDEDELEEEEHDYIDDYNKNEYEDSDADPATGYGPANAHQLVLNGNYRSFRNADNYRWYAVSKYWSWRCTQATGGHRVIFGGQTNNALGDDIVPRGADGQIPWPLTSARSRL